MEFGSHIVDFQEVLAVLQIDADIGGDGVHHLERVIHVERGRDQLRRDAGHQFRQPGEQIYNIAAERFNLDVGFRLLLVAADPCHQVGLGGGVFLHFDTSQPLDQQADRAIRGPEQAMHCRDRADGVDVIWVGLFVVGVFSCYQSDQPFLARHIVNQPDGARLAHGQRNGGEWVHHHAAQGEDRQSLRDFDIVFVCVGHSSRGNADHLLLGVVFGRWRDFPFFLFFVFRVVLIVCHKALRYASSWSSSGTLITRIWVASRRGSSILSSPSR